MPRRSPGLVAGALTLALLAGGAAWWWQALSEGEAPAQRPCASPEEVPPAVGLMSSLPLYWPIDADFAALANGTAEAPWQRLAIERCQTLVPLDTLSPDAAGTDPLAGRARLAVIQPRGLSPADNVALDDWVRGGGRLLLVLDPMLTGDYDLALGDPRRPADMALIPPVVARWGLEVVFDEAQPPEREVRLGDVAVPLSLAGEVGEIAGSAAACEMLAEQVLARCRVGAGRVTLVTDAAMFEGAVSSPAKSAAIQALMDFAFEDVAIGDRAGK